MIVPEAALRAAYEWSEHEGTGVPVPVLHGLLTAALPHLTQPVVDGVDGEYWTRQLDRIHDRITQVFNEVSMSHGAQQAGDWTAQERAIERQHQVWHKRLTQGGEVHEETSGPTAYEMWRDALHLAVVGEGPGYSPGSLMENAEWFHDRLKRGAPGPPVPDCPHCGADSSMDHDDDCPSAASQTESAQAD